MNLKYSYWYFKSALPSHFCDKLIEFGNSKKEQIGITGGINTKKSNEVKRI